MNSIVSVFAQATVAELAEGMNWYATARSAAQALATQHNLSLHTVAGVIAALSPNMRWELNVKAADTIIKAYKMGIAPEDATCPAYKANRRKAYQILAETERANITKILNGNKIVNFYLCIVEPNCSAVCIDGHARNIYYGSREVLKGSRVTDKEYNLLVEEYNNATQAINLAYNFQLTAMQVQAVTWVVWRRMHKI